MLRIVFGWVLVLVLLLLVLVLLVLLLLLSLPVSKGSIDRSTGNALQEV